MFRNAIYDLDLPVSEALHRVSSNLLIKAVDKSTFICTKT